MGKSFEIGLWSQSDTGIVCYTSIGLIEFV